MKRICLYLSSALAWLASTQCIAAVAAPIEVKVVVVTMFEIGKDQGDRPGEFQLWKEKYALNQRFAFAHHHDLFFNPETGVLGMVTGMGIGNASSAIMALGLDPRFDLSKAYWLVAGIAGLDPADASIGSAVWATWLVDGDLAHQIDAREIPADWSTGYFPLFATAPYPDTKVFKGHNGANGEVYKLNEKLADWAFNLTKDIKLNDYPGMQSLRKKYVNFPAAQQPPSVLKGDHLAASTFWHGALLNQWANDWTSFWTDDEGNFVTSGMEDTGSYQAMLYLHKAGKVDKNRFMVLRTGSNYVMQHQGLTAAQNLAAESGETGYAGMQSALESAVMVGGKVVETLVENWPKYRDNLPYEASQVKNSAKLMLSKDKKAKIEQLVKQLNLQAHVEGGYFRQTFKSPHSAKSERGQRSILTSIYYLLTADSPIGHFHKNQSDIMHYFHQGDPITYYLLHPDGQLEERILGPDIAAGQELQFVVPGDVWKASKIDVEGALGYALIGEAVAPGFEYQDMQLGKTSTLIEQFPQHQVLIKELSREQTEQ